MGNFVFTTIYRCFGVAILLLASASLSNTFVHEHWASSVTLRFSGEAVDDPVAVKVARPRGLNQTFTSYQVRRVRPMATWQALGRMQPGDASSRSTLWRVEGGWITKQHLSLRAAADSSAIGLQLRLNRLRQGFSLWDSVRLFSRAQSPPAVAAVSTVEPTPALEMETAGSAE